MRFDTGGSSYGGYPGGGGDGDINDLLSQMFGGAAGGAAGGRAGQGSYAGYGAPRGPRKGADVLALNVVGWASGFGRVDTAVVAVDAAGTVLGEAEGSKADVAEALWDVVVGRLPER